MDPLRFLNFAHADSLAGSCQTITTGTQVGQTLCSPNWQVGTSTGLISNVESSTAGMVISVLPLVIPITIGLAVFFFFFGWLLRRARGHH